MLLDRRVRYPKRCRFRRARGHAHGAWSEASASGQRLRSDAALATHAKPTAPTRLWLPSSRTPRTNSSPDTPACANVDLHPEPFSVCPWDRAGHRPSNVRRAFFALIPSRLTRPPRAGTAMGKQKALSIVCKVPVQSIPAPVLHHMYKMHSLVCPTALHLNPTSQYQAAGTLLP